MFTTFRQRLLFWFFLLISMSVMIIFLTQLHFLARDKILRSTSMIESAYILLLKDVNVQHDFFTYDIRNKQFFTAGNSEYTSKHLALRDSIHEVIQKALGSSYQTLPVSIQTSLSTADSALFIIDSLFDSLKNLVHRRGYRDYNLEGRMRFHAHWLERNHALQQEQLLSLRRHEKDYIIRNDHEYVAAFNGLLQQVMAERKSGNDSTRIHLASYQKDFNELVALDSLIGNKDNSGLKRALDLKTGSLENFFTGIVREAQKSEAQSLRQLNLVYLLITLLLTGVSLLASFIISRRITKPLTELTQYITRFVDSQFMAEEQTPRVRSKDEIGKLTENFTLLKEEVISHLKFFKQKVEERTSELDAVNKRLTALNESNSRFVPKEFLQHLSKASIEEIRPGDQVAREMTVMFTDIRSFTRISETLSPQENFDFINDYLKEIVPIIRKHNGFIDKFIGDTVMALFPDHPDDAIRAAMEFDEAVLRFNDNLKGTGIEPVVIGTGIHTGNLILGTIGNDYRLETTVISDAVNIASRIEGLCKHYQAGIIVSEESLVKLKDPREFCFRYLDEVRVKGKTRSVLVYEILTEAKDQVKIFYQHDFEWAIKHLKARQIPEARHILTDLSLRNPDDWVVKIFLQRFEKFLAEGYPSTWDGIEVMHSK